MKQANTSNTRATFTAENGLAKLTQSTDYYPFGQAFAAPDGDPYHNANPFLYNGKELQTDLGLGWYSYGVRVYDPVIGRFPTIDPIIEKFYYLTPYNYASNNPVTNIDLWGLQGINSNDVWYIVGPELTSIKSAANNIISSISNVSHSVWNFVEGIANKTSDNVVLVGSSITMPIINQAYVISQEGVHEGSADNPANNLNWAVPYSIDENWNLVSQNSLTQENISYEDGKKLLNATVGVITLVAPIKGLSPNKVLDKMISIGTKTASKTAVKKGLNSVDKKNQTVNACPSCEEKQNRTMYDNYQKTLSPSDEIIPYRQFIERNRKKSERNEGLGIY